MVLLLLCLWLNNTAYSQTVFSTSNGVSKSDEITISWSIGETVISTISNENSVTQGFHQPTLICSPCDEDSSIETNLNADNNQIDSNLSLLLYPNPAIDELKIEANIPETGDWFFAIYNSTGRLIHLDQQFLEPNQLMIRTVDVSSFIGGQYFSRIYNDKHSITKRFIVSH